MDKAKLSILAIIPYRFLPAVFGGQKAILFFYNALSRIAEVHAIGVDSNDKSQVPFPLNGNLGDSQLRYANPFLVGKIGRQIANIHPDYISTEHPYLGWLLLLLRRKYKTPILIHSHNIEAIRFKTIGKNWWRLMYAYEKKIYRAADKLCFITEEDRLWAIENYGVDAQRAIVFPYSISNTKAFTAVEKSESKKIVYSQLKLDFDRKMIFFNGAFDYKPNLEALQHLLFVIFPKLKRVNSDFVLIVCGKKIPPEITNIKDEQLKILGFVDDIQLYFKAADVFVNPIIEGGGVKTKLIEALAAGAQAVSYRSGAIGIPIETTGNVLQSVADNDADGFTQSVQKALYAQSQLPTSFFDYFNEEKTSKRIAEFLAK